MAQVPEWTIGQAVTKGALRTFTQSGRLDVFVALQDSDASSVWIEPSTNTDFWLELDNYNGPHVAGIRYPKGHIVDHVVAGQTLWYIASDDTSQEPPGSGWLLFGGARVPPVPSAALLPTRWRSPITIVRNQCVATGIDLDDLPDAGQSLFRVEPPSGADTTDQERLLFTAQVKALAPVAVGDNLLTAAPGTTLQLSEAPSITDRALIARTAENGLVLQIPDNARYPLAQAARFTFAHERAWPVLFFDAVSGDVAFTAAANGELIGTLAPTVRDRLVPTPTVETRGRYVRQSPDAETYELAVGSPDVTGPVYATFADVQASGSTNADREELYNRLLRSASRLIDRELDMMPGGFAPVDHRTFHFRGSGRRRLRLRDPQGQMYPLRSVDADGIRPDYDGTGDYDETDYAWDLEDAWVWPTLIDAVAIGRPIYGLELRRIQTAPLTIWPTRDRSVQITGDWGWAAVPEPIRELTVGCARQAADAHQGGLAAVVEGMDEAVMLGGDAWRLWDRVRQEYGTRSKRGGMPVGFRS